MNRHQLDEQGAQSSSGMTSELMLYLHFLPMTRQSFPGQSLLWALTLAKKSLQSLWYADDECSQQARSSMLRSWSCADLVLVLCLVLAAVCSTRVHGTLPRGMHTMAVTGQAAESHFMALTTCYAFSCRCPLESTVQCRAGFAG